MAAHQADDEALARALQADEERLAALAVRRRRSLRARARERRSLFRARVASAKGGSARLQRCCRRARTLTGPRTPSSSIAWFKARAPPAPPDDSLLAAQLHAQLNGGGEAAVPRARTPSSTPAGAPPQLADDFAAALRLHEQLNGAEHAHPRLPLATPAPSEQRQQHGDACGGCGRLVGPFQRGVRVKGRAWHAACLRCSACGEPIAGPPPGGARKALAAALGVGTGATTRFVESDGQFFHPQCAREALTPRCTICQDFVRLCPESNSYEYVRSTGRYFPQTWCRWHGRAPPSCCACGRVEPISTPFAEHTDGRRLCLECLGDVVVDTNDAAPLVDELHVWYEAMGMAIRDKHFPVYLVDGRSLLAARSKEGEGHHYQPPSEAGAADSAAGIAGEESTAPQLEVRGLCVTLSRSVRVVERDPAAAGGGGLLGGLVAQLAVAQRQIALSTTTHEVQAVLALFGLPRLLTGAILAHEFCHAYFKLSGYPRLEALIEEGLCQLMAWLWLQQQGRTPLRDCFSHAIEQETDAIYGNGFRAARAALDRSGGALHELLAHVRLTGMLPTHS